MTSTSSTDQHRTQPSEHKSPKAQETPPFYAKIIRRIQSRGHDKNVSKRVFERLARPSQERLDASLNDAPIDADKLIESETPAPEEKSKSVFYLAYGSNLCNETFRGARGIRPLSQVNVLVPSLRLTFDLAGIPYAEPCFANTARRDPDAPSKHSEHTSDYHKDRWHKGLVGVVYEVTLSDYAHIIATEGGGSSYTDILIDCYVLPPSDTVPLTPTSKPFKAHTLFAPVANEDGTRCSSERNSRPDPSYAQPSARYLKLITDGAAECELPAEYQAYLGDIRPYTITSRKQTIGKALFMAIWMPFVIFIFTLSRQLQDKKGRAPKWFGWLTTMLFKAMWFSYDGIFKRTFGDGERTEGDSALVKRQTVGDISASEVEKEGLLEDAFHTLDMQRAGGEERAGRRTSIV